jgi:hypothetical protein
VSHTPVTHSEHCVLPKQSLLSKQSQTVANSHKRQRTEQKSSILSEIYFGGGLLSSSPRHLRHHPSILLQQRSSMWSKELHINLRITRQSDPTYVSCHNLSHCRSNFEPMA